MLPTRLPQTPDTIETRWNNIRVEDRDPEEPGITALWIIALQLAQLTVKLDTVIAHLENIGGHIQTITEK